VLALVASSLPTRGVRVLLLSVAVVDDLIAITLIAIVFTADISVAWLAGGLAVCALYALTFRYRVDRAWLLWLLAIVCWICIHASGVHATVAGILLDDVAIGIFFGLVVGKLAGVLGGARLAVALRLGALPTGVRWADVLPWVYSRAGGTP
jgi:Na+:H+ antiporter, NhaA family